MGEALEPHDLEAEQSLLGAMLANLAELRSSVMLLALEADL